MPPIPVGRHERPWRVRHAGVPDGLAAVSNADGGAVVAGGTIAVPDAQGLGVTPKLDVLGDPVAIDD